MVKVGIALSSTIAIASAAYAKTQLAK